MWRIEMRFGMDEDDSKSGYGSEKTTNLHLEGICSEGGMSMFVSLGMREVTCMHT